MNDSPPRVVEGAYLRDILDQPGVVRRVTEYLSALQPPSITHGIRDGRFKRIVLTGMGSSLYVLYQLESLPIMSKPRNFSSDIEAFMRKTRCWWRCRSRVRAQKLCSS